MSKKTLVWDGIFQGYKYVTKKEMKDRKELQKRILISLLKGFGIIIAIYILLWFVIFSI